MNATNVGNIPSEFLNELVDDTTATWPRTDVVYNDTQGSFTAYEPWSNGKISYVTFYHTPASAFVSSIVDQRIADYMGDEASALAELFSGGEIVNPFPGAPDDRDHGYTLIDHTGNPIGGITLTQGDKAATPTLGQAGNEWIAVITSVAAS
jgi:hypothetical protein